MGLLHTRWRGVLFGRELAKLWRSGAAPLQGPSLPTPRSGESIPCFALLARRFKFVAGLPSGQFWLRSRFTSERETESRHLRQSGEIHFRAILVAGLMIIMIDVIFRLRLAPRGIVAFVFQSFANRKRGHTNTRETKMIGAVV